MVAKMAGLIAVLVLGLIILGIYTWNQGGALKELGGLVAAAQSAAQVAVERLEGEQARLGRALKEERTSRVQAEADLARALVHLRRLAKEGTPETKAWLLTPVPSEVQGLLKEDEGRETP